MKKIYPHSVLIIIFEIFFSAICILCSGGIIFCFIEGCLVFDWYSCLAVISAIIVFAGSFIIFLSLIKKRIIINDEDIFVPADIADKKGLFLRRLQHRTSVKFEEIESIYLIAARRDSKNNHVKNVFVSMPYIVFSCKDGQKKMINVYYYSKKQVAYIIDEIKNRASLIGNDLQIQSGKEVVSEFIQKQNKRTKRKVSKFCEKTK